MGLSIVEVSAILLKLAGSVILTIPLVILLLACFTWIHQNIRSKLSGKPLSLTTSLYCGRVSHTRFQPVKHCFSYPLFFCLVDLREVKELFKGRLPLLWPLNYFITFRDEDHLKNGEGTLSSGENASSQTAVDTLSPRIRELVKERTNGKFIPSADQKILLLTHLSYFGYCFNPVSFYYILKKDYSSSDETIEAIVAEVSNTPWNEMKCYVLHPDSIDVDVVKDGRPRKINEMIDWAIAESGALDKETNENDSHRVLKSINYIFKKTFHVSPFMDMDHMYDWTFWHLTKDRIVVSTTMKKSQRKTEGNDESSPATIKYFNAFFDIYRSSFNPFHLCYQLVRFPVYCMIIQVWIHIEAFRLFLKGVEFIPHPKGAETTASVMISHAMTPFFAAKDWLTNGSKKNVKVE